VFALDEVMGAGCTIGFGNQLNQFDDVRDSQELALAHDEVADTVGGESNCTTAENLVQRIP
jgi:hypothetical protein